MRRRILHSAHPAEQNMAENRYLLEGKPGPTVRIFDMDRNREPKVAALVLLPTCSGTTWVRMPTTPISPSFARRPPALAARCRGASRAARSV